MPRLRTALICHAEDSLDAGVLPAWLGTFSDFAGCVVIAERRSTLWRRVRNELRRSGWLGFLDVIAFKIYFRLVCAAGAGRRLDELQRRLRERYPGGAGAAPSLLCHSPNTEEARAFLQSLRPDVVIARCKFILKEEVYSIATRGTFVLHPGVCPEYRNAHGCFWALAAGDREHVGATLLQVDRGVDTGPVYGYFSYPLDERQDSHLEIQTRVVYDNLEAIQARLLEIGAGSAVPIDTRGRKSAVWGQPRLTAYLRWKAQARQ